jgi:glycosyltransferase involved in cell wall biosynthesis
MNGGMDFPPAYAGESGLLERAVYGIGRQLAHAVNQIIPGKRDAAVLLTANPRTRAALPRCAAARVVNLPENGVDLSLFQHRSELRAPRASVRFAFMGRLVDWKRVDLLLEALQRCPAHYELEILGEGNMRPALEARAAALKLSARVRFFGLLSQQECSQRLGECDALVLPSMRECGGAVVLEAMAMGLPVIATAWGGPIDYLDATSGILVPPDSPKTFVVSLANAMQKLGASPELRAELGAAGRARVERDFDWERKIDRILDVYAEAAGVLPQRRAPREERISLELT